MRVLKKLAFHNGQEEKLAEFGYPDTQEEIAEMFDLRFRVYKNKNYLNSEVSTEKDEYDNGKSVYFIGKCDGKIVATVRLIIDASLPMERIFSFEEPDFIKNLADKEVAEISRLVISGTREINAPRNIFLLFLISCLVDHAIKNNIKGGYAFIKESLVKKLSLLSVPVNKIENYTQNYPENGFMWQYFNDKDDKVIPHYVSAQSVGDYCDKIMHKDNMFEIDNEIFNLKNGLYVNFLRKMNIL